MGHARRRADRLPGKEPKTLNQAIRELTESLGIRKTLGEYDVILSWGEIVGERIARVATPERVEKGVLIVRVESATWRNELTMRRPEILDKIRTNTGKRVIKDIRFR